MIFESIFYLKPFISCRWGRWTEILEQGAFKRGWKESDVEDCSRVIVSFTADQLIHLLRPSQSVFGL